MLTAREKPRPTSVVQSTSYEKDDSFPVIREGMSPQRTLMSEIENAVRGGKLVLRKVDTAAEMENSKKMREKTQFQQLMDEVRKRSAANERRMVLLDQGTIPPKEFWKVSLGRWYEEVEKAFVADHMVMKVVFTLLERTEDEISFEEARKIVAPSTSLDTLAAHMNGMGFTVKRNKILMDEKNQKEKIEYVALLKPSNFPVKYMLRAILLAVGDRPQDAPAPAPSSSSAARPGSSSATSSAARPGSANKVVQQPVFSKQKQKQVDMSDLDSLLQGILFQLCTVAYPCLISSEFCVISRNRVCRLKLNWHFSFCCFLHDGTFGLY